MVFVFFAFRFSFFHVQTISLWNGENDGMSIRFPNGNHQLLWPILRHTGWVASTMKDHQVSWAMGMCGVQPFQFVIFILFFGLLQLSSYHSLAWICGACCIRCHVPISYGIPLKSWNIIWQLDSNRVKHTDPVPDNLSFSLIWPDSMWNSIRGDRRPKWLFHWSKATKPIIRRS